jgi:hypothetical protein
MNISSLSELKKFYKIRDMFLGDNFTTQNIPEALKLAKTCDHPEAHWLINVFADDIYYNNSTIKLDEIINLLCKQTENEATALCYAAMVGNISVGGPKTTTSLYGASVNRMTLSAKMGNAYARSKMYISSYTFDPEWLHNSVAQGERNAYWVLGTLYLGQRNIDHNNTLRDVDMARFYFLKAIELGHIQAMMDYGGTFNELCLERYKWKGKGLVCITDFHNRHLFMLHVQNYITKWSDQDMSTFHLHLADPQILFAITQALKIWIEGKSNYYTRNLTLEEYIRKYGKSTFNMYSVLRILLDKYTLWYEASRKRLDTWTMIAKRLGICRDMRKYIGELVWEDRNDKEYMGSFLKDTDIFSYYSSTFTYNKSNF